MSWSLQVTVLNFIGSSWGENINWKFHLEELVTFMPVDLKTLRKPDVFGWNKLKTCRDTDLSLKFDIRALCLHRNELSDVAVFADHQFNL